MLVLAETVRAAIKMFSRSLKPDWKSSSTSALQAGSG
jgi:hypothetical protein